VCVWTEAKGEARRAELRDLRTRLAAARRFGAGEPSASPFADRRELLGYISGFVCAEGCFGLSGGRPRFTIHLRQDDQPLLEMLAEASGLGSVTSHRPAQPLNPSATWTVSARAELAELRDLLWQGGLPGRKSREMEVWALAVDELNRGARVGVRPRREVIQAAREDLSLLRAYRPPDRRELLRLAGRDRRAEALDALTAWSRDVDEELTSTGYMRWRLEHPGAPNRNTIVRQFGSWYGALEAVGLGDRAARAQRPAGGAERRQRRRAEQQERVLAAVRRFESEHGWLPRAMEFFRWRYESAIDAPTQASVYKLFPGGWPVVLERTRQVAGATV
jgi:hypothetical protein